MKEFIYLKELSFLTCGGEQRTQLVKLNLLTSKNLIVSKKLYKLRTLLWKHAENLKTKNELEVRILKQSHRAEKCERWTLLDSLTSNLLKNMSKNDGGSL